MPISNVDKPDFFIVGAPRCATTAMYYYLSQHPEIFTIGIKEPHYFCEDFPKLRAIITYKAYLRLFKKSHAEHKIAGEATTSYLYSSVALSKIRDFNHSAKIIIQLRNPVDFVRSMHGRLVGTGEENETDIVKAWRLQENRRKGQHVPPLCREPFRLQYQSMGMFGYWMEKAFQVFPPQQIKVIICDDLASSPREVYEDVLCFLGVASDGRTDFPTINRSVLKGRMKWLIQFVFRPPKYIRTVSNAVKSVLGIDNFGLYRVAERRLLVRGEKPPLPANLRAELQSVFRNDVEKLGNLIERDLSHWCED